MRAAAVCLTYGRAALGELLGCIQRQTLLLPVVLYVDNAPHVKVRCEGAPGVAFVLHGDNLEHFGTVRRTAIEFTRHLLQLAPEDAVLVLDDDDFYSSRHFEVTTRALELAPGGWTGGLAMGIARSGAAPEYVRGASGVGQHATWGYTLARYDAGGGYPAELDRDEDTALGWGMGWKNCAPHFECTYVKREHPANISGFADFDRDMVRRLDKLQTEIRPTWTDECEALERWCNARNTQERSP